MKESCPEATLRRDASGGLAPADEGWFIVNLAEACAMHSERFGDGCRFEGAARFPEFGINVRVLSPGTPAARARRSSPSLTTSMPAPSAASVLSTAWLEFAFMAYATRTFCPAKASRNTAKWRSIVALE